jgi:hypothetical protein
MGTPVAHRRIRRAAPWIGVFAVAATALAGCGDDRPAAERLAVQVEVTLGPSCPVEQPGVDCPPLPLTGYQVVATRGGDVVRADLPDDGRVTLDLAAGTWQLTATAGMSCETVTVSMSTSVTIACDSGIR